MKPFMAIGFLYMAQVATVAEADQDHGVERALVLAEQFHRQGDYTAVAKLLLETLKENGELGPEDQRTAVVLNNLGSAYQYQNKYIEAEGAYRRALEICGRICASDEILLVRLTVNLANLYFESGQHAKAERLELRKLSARFGRLKPDHPEVARLLAASGTLASAQGRYPEAEEYYRRTLESLDRLGPNHPDSINVLNNLASLYAKTGRNAEALACFEHTLLIAGNKLSRRHPAYPALLFNIASLRFLIYGPSDAEPFFKDALLTAEDALGPEDPRVGRILSAYATVLERLKRKSEARKCQQRAKAIMQAAFREDPKRYSVDIQDLRRSSSK